ncbi:hypothetical protein GCK72_021537 [Caenorhabditis remanei]|uniref:Uncharacterized protein n=1 Tax=Caenorhabditis remanei TaxID=31234 RepID=A0A6A5GK46_CAERE|nr:hypothetical protein GCK72_021537 [Caenorhabditis remanei]KAF1754971.1 hypothetical protein GCK72_021537 [Caenorhabditis remanei]
MLLAVFLLISLCTMVSTTDVTLTVEVTKISDPKCGKYMQNHKKPVLKIRYVRLLHTASNDDNGDEFVSNILCQPKSNGYNSVEGKYTFECIYNGAPPPSINAFVFAVGTDQQMMSSQIEYRYKEDTMRMFTFLNPDNVMTQKFTHNSHLHIRNITYTVNKKPHYLTDDNCLDKYPDSLIADHGLYIRKGNEETYTRIYFDPVDAGEKLVKPVII